jgi:hypothetical protein
VALVRSRGVPVGVSAHPALARVHGIDPALLAPPPAGPALVVSWDARVMGGTADTLQARVLGNAWEENFDAISARRGGST